MEYAAFLEIRLTFLQYFGFSTGDFYTRATPYSANFACDGITTSDKYTFSWSTKSGHDLAVSCFLIAFGKRSGFCVGSALLVNECSRPKALGRLDPADSSCPKTSRAQFEFALLLAAALCLGFSLARLVSQPLAFSLLLEAAFCLGGSLARFVSYPLTFSFL